MKILFVCSLYPPHAIGGAEKAASLLAEALVRKGHEVVVVSLHDQPSECVESLNGVRVYRLPIDNYYWPFGRKCKPSKLFRLAWHLRDMWNSKAVRRIARILEMESPTVVHTHNICGFSVAVWREVKNRQIRLVHTLHDYYLLCSRCTLFSNGKVCRNRCFDCTLLSFNKMRMSRLPDSVVSVSQCTLEEHTRRNYFEGVDKTVIHNMLDFRIVPVRPVLNCIEHRDGLIFGFIGKIEAEKGIETLLEAVRRLQSSNWKLRIAGAGLDKYVDGLKKNFADKRIEWLGVVNSAEFYSSVHVVVIPSEWLEPLSYVCAEAIREGRAMICALSGGIPEIARFGKVVEFFPAGDANALSEIMHQALITPHRWREPRCEANPKLDLFREESVLQSYLNEYGFEVAGVAHSTS